MFTETRILNEEYPFIKKDRPVSGIEDCYLINASIRCKTDILYYHNLTRTYLPSSN
jgi:hypothetical protein